MDNPLLLELISKQMTEAIDKRQELQTLIYKCQTKLQDMIQVGDEMLVYTDGSRILPGRIVRMPLNPARMSFRLLIDGVWTEETYELDSSRIRGNIK